MASSSNSSMMSTIDSLKDKMSDEVYLALCEKMKELHTEQQQDEDSKIPVRIWFMTVHTEYIDEDRPGHMDGDPCGELYEVVPVQRILMMTRAKMEEMKSTIDSTPRRSVCYSFSNAVNIDVHEAPSVSHVEPLNPYHVNVYRVEEV